MDADNLILLYRISTTVFVVSALGALSRALFVRQLAPWFFGVAIAGYVAAIFFSQVIDHEAGQALEKCFLSRPGGVDLELAWARCRQQVLDVYGIDPL